MKKITLKFVMLFIMALFLGSCSNDDLIEETSGTGSTERISADVNTNAVIAQAGPNLPDTYSVKKYVFLRTSGAPTPLGPLGHVGAGFELRARINGVNYVSFYFGSVENSDGTAFILPGQYNAGWWLQYSTQADMLSTMKARGYDKYKFQQIFYNTEITRVNAGKAILFNFPKRGYSLPANNCMNAAFDLLQNFSFPGEVNVPSVPINYFPTNWYNSLSVNGGWSGSVNL